MLATLLLKDATVQITNEIKILTQLHLILTLHWSRRKKKLSWMNKLEHPLIVWVFLVTQSPIQTTTSWLLRRMSANVDLYLSRPRNILGFFGIWLQPGRFKLLYTTYTLFILFTQYSFILFEFIYIEGVWGNMDAVTEASFLLFTQASLCFKVTRFLMNQGKLVTLLQFMEEEIFMPRSKIHER